MRVLISICAAALLASACGGGAGTPPAQTGAASAARPIATLAAPLTSAASASPAAASSASAPVATTAVAGAATESAAASAAATSSAASPAAGAAGAGTPAPAAPAGSGAAATPAPQTPAPATSTAAAQPAFSGTVKVALTDNAIRPDRTSVPAGPVTFSIVNTGYLTHELVVLQTSIAQDQLPLSTTDPKMVQTPGQVGAASNIAAGATATLTLNLSAGPYVLICNIENHYKDGMHTAFTVGGS